MFDVEIPDEVKRDVIEKLNGAEQTVLSASGALLLRQGASVLRYEAIALRADRGSEIGAIDDADNPRGLAVHVSRVTVPFEDAEDAERYLSEQEKGEGVSATGAIWN